MQVMQAMVEVGAETNLVTGLLTSGALTASPGILAMLEDRFTASARRAEKQLAKLPAGAKFDPLKERVRGLVKLADFKPREATATTWTRLTAGVPRARGADQPADRPDRRPQFRRRDAERGRGEAHQQDGQGPGRGADHRPAQRARGRGADPSRHQPAQRSRRRQGRRRAGADAGPLQGRHRPAGQGRQDAHQRGDQGARSTSCSIFGQGDNSLFALRAHELAAIARADKTIEENVTIQRSLDRAVAVLVGDAEKSMQSRLGQAGRGSRPQPHAADDRRGGRACWSRARSACSTCSAAWCGG